MSPSAWVSTSSACTARAASASSSAIRGIPKEAGLRRGHQHRVPGRRDHQGQGYPGRVRASQARHPRSLLLPRGLPEKLDGVMDFCTQCQIKKATERRGLHVKCEHQQSCISALHCHPKAIWTNQGQYHPRRVRATPELQCGVALARKSSRPGPSTSSSCNTRALSATCTTSSRRSRRREISSMTPIRLQGPRS